MIVVESESLCSGLFQGGLAGWRMENGFITRISDGGLWRSVGETLNICVTQSIFLWLLQCTSDNLDNLLGYVEIRLFVRYYILVSRCISNTYSSSFDSTLSIPSVWLIVIRLG